MQVDPFCWYQEVTLGRRPTVGGGGGGGSAILKSIRIRDTLLIPRGKLSALPLVLEEDFKKHERKAQRNTKKKKMMSSLL